MPLIDCSRRLEFRIPLKPVPKGRPRFSRKGFAYTPKETRAYEQLMREYVRDRYHRPPFAGPLKLTCGFYLPRPKRPKHPLPVVKPDLDNLVKAVKDALEGVLWAHDQQVVDLFAQKRYTSGETCTMLTVEEVEYEEV